MPQLVAHVAHVQRQGYDATLRGFIIAGLIESWHETVIFAFYHHVCAQFLHYFYLLIKAFVSFADEERLVDV